MDPLESLSDLDSVSLAGVHALNVVCYVLARIQLCVIQYLHQLFKNSDLLFYITSKWNTRGERKGKSVCSCRYKIMLIPASLYFSYSKTNLG